MAFVGKVPSARARAKRTGRTPPAAKVGPKAAMALQAIASAAGDEEPVPATPGAPPPVQAALAAARAPAGATDGLGAGQGGLALHPSVKGLNIHGREPRHTSKTR